MRRPLKWQGGKWAKLHMRVQNLALSSVNLIEMNVGMCLFHVLQVIGTKNADDSFTSRHTVTVMTAIYSATAKPIVRIQLFSMDVRFL